MSNKLNIILLIFSALTIQGCATYSAPHDELISKALTPPSGQALIYIIRASGHKGRLRAIPFTFNQEKIGDIWADQYLYVHANPMQILLPQADGSTYKLNILANRTYYLLYGFEGSFFDAVLDPFTWEKLHFNVLSSREGRELINEYRLSGEFRRVIIGYSAASTINNKNMSTTSYETNAYEYVYENSTKQGSVTVTGSNNIRDNAINKIKDICLIKNVALSTNGMNSNTSATFVTLSEKLNQNKLHMQFECIY